MVRLVRPARPSLAERGRRRATIDVSLSHTGDLALAVAVAITNPMSNRETNQHDAVVTDTIRALLAEHARLGVDVASLSDTDDLYGAGMTSHASVTVMLACEDEWDLEFPQQMLKKSTFASVDANIRARSASSRSPTTRRWRRR